MPTSVPTSIPSSTPTTAPSASPTPVPTRSPKAKKQSDELGIGIIAAIAAGCVAFVLLLFLAFFLYRRRRRTQKEQQQDSPSTSRVVDPEGIQLEDARAPAPAPNYVDDSDFADWDYAPVSGESSEIPHQPEARGSALESYAQRRRGRVVTLVGGGDSAHVRWHENDPFAHALVRRLDLGDNANDDADAPVGSGLVGHESLELVSAVDGFDVSLAADADLRGGLLRADVWPFDQRSTEVKAALGRLRVPHSEGRVELRVRRSDCYAGALKAYKKLSRKAWRMGWFVRFHGEAGLDAGGLSREFWRLTLARAFSEDAGLFARTADGTYDCVDAFEEEIADKLPEYRFVGRSLAKLLFDNHSGCLEAPLNVKILKLLVGEPIVFDDLQLVDEQLWLSLTKLEALAMNNPDRLADLCLTFSVDRLSALTGSARAVDLVDGGADLAVDGDNMDRFLEARMREAIFEKHRSQLLALLAGFYDICPPAVVLLLTARELELALNGELQIDIEDWKRHTAYHGAFEAEQDRHPVCKAFWDTVQSWDDEHRTRLLQWAIGTARLPLGGFANLQQRDGVSRRFTLTSVALESAIYPRSHTCFNRIDLPLYANPDVDVPGALDFVVTHATAEFTLD